MMRNQDLLPLQDRSNSPAHKPYKHNFIALGNSSSRKPRLQKSQERNATDHKKSASQQIVENIENLGAHKVDQDSGVFILKLQDKILTTVPRNINADHPVPKRLKCTPSQSLQQKCSSISTINSNMDLKEQTYHIFEVSEGTPMQSDRDNLYPKRFKNKHTPTQTSTQQLLEQLQQDIARNDVVKDQLKDQVNVFTNRFKAFNRKSSNNAMYSSRSIGERDFKERKSSCTSATRSTRGGKSQTTLMRSKSTLLQKQMPEKSIPRALSQLYVETNITSASKVSKDFSKNRKLNSKSAMNFVTKREEVYCKIDDFMGQTNTQLEDKSKLRKLLVQEQNHLTLIWEASQKESIPLTKKQIEIELESKAMKEKNQQAEKDIKKLKEEAIRMRNEISNFCIHFKGTQQAQFLERDIFVKRIDSQFSTMEKERDFNETSLTQQKQRIFQLQESNAIKEKEMLAIYAKEDSLIKKELGKVALLSNKTQNFVQGLKDRVYDCKSLKPAKKPSFRF